MAAVPPLASSKDDDSEICMFCRRKKKHCLRKVNVQLYEVLCLCIICWLIEDHRPVSYAGHFIPRDCTSKLQNSKTLLIEIPYTQISLSENHYQTSRLLCNHLSISTNTSPWRTPFLVFWVVAYDGFDCIKGLRHGDLADFWPVLSWN